MSSLLLIPIAGTLALALYGIYRWASADPEIDRQAAKQHLRSQQDWRALRRAGKLE